jgi:alkanesulfonate monooxygenase SsuD/methylene tetrahydromethanopterin reductase-like flavin-dependent oxidoreductase (luciferase family)
VEASLILDIFSELQKAKPWGPAHERAVIEEAIEQAKLADELGYACWWNVEHHGAVEFSYSSSPELMPAVLSQHTERLRFGHSGILAPFNINHPVRVAERAAFLDIVSGGRMEIGLARSGGAEWETFGVDPDTSRQQLREALQMIPKMWTQESFQWKSDLIEVPERKIVPKPLQQPHPPLWQTATSPESFEMAGELGVGALATTLFTPLDSLRELFSRYAEGMRRVTPAGSFANDQRAVFTFLHCAETEQEAIDSRAGEHALWFVNTAPRVFSVPRSIWIDAIRGQLQSNDPRAAAAVEGEDVIGDIDLDDPVPVIRLLNRQIAGQELDPVEVYETLLPIESVVIGDIDSCRKKLEGYDELGVDRLMCLMQFGALPHELVMRSIRTAGEALVPEFNG